MTFFVDKPRAEVVLGKIWARYESGEYPYNQHAAMLPQNHIPADLPLGGAEEAWYWMAMCLFMRGPINTTDAAKALATMYRLAEKSRGRNPFIVSEAARKRPSDLVKLLERGRIGMHQVVPDWISNAQLIARRWDGNVLNLLDGVDDYDEACLRILRSNGGFAGFGYKMVSMLLYFLMERGLVASFPFPPPVDFHLQRVAIATKLIDRSDARNGVFAKNNREIESIEAHLRELYFWFQVSRGLPGNRFTDSLWLLSKRICVLNPGNRTHSGEYRARRTEQKAHVPTFQLERDRKNYAKSCGVCPASAECQRNVPSGPRYRKGILLTSPRIDPLTLVDVPACFEAKAKPQVVKTSPAAAVSNLQLF